MKNPLQMKYMIMIMPLIFTSGASAQTYQDGDSTFNLPVIHTIEFTFTQPSFWDSLLYYYPLDQPMVGSVTIDGQLIDSVGVQLKGNSSFNSIPGVKKPFKISFDEFRDQKFDGLKTLNLNNSFKDPTFLREKLMLDFLRRQGAAAPRCSYADVYINGTHWGFYTVVEQVNKTFLNDVIGNKDGNLFKGDPMGHLKWKGSATQSLYENDYELKTNEALNDWSDLIHLISHINNTSAAGFHDSVETVLNTPAFIRYWACANIFANLDSYLGSGHNYYIYHNSASGLFDWITWDVNEAFGNFQMGMNLTQIKNLNVLYVSNPPMNRPLINRMIQDNTYRIAYLDQVHQYMLNDFSPWYFYPLIDSIADVIRPFVYADPNKQFTSANFEFNIDHDMGNIPGLKDFIYARRNSLDSQLTNLGYTPLTVNEPLSVNEPDVYPNPAGDEIFIRALGPQEEMYFQLYDITGRKMMMEPVIPGITRIPLPDISSGLYFYRVVNAGAVIKAGRIIIR